MIFFLQNYGEASAMLQAAEFVLVNQDRHKPPLSEAYTRSKREKQAPMYWKGGTRPPTGR